MKKIIGTILIIASVGLAVIGVNTWNSSTESVEILNVELSASDQEGKNTAFIYFGLSLAALIGGVAMVSRK